MKTPIKILHNTQANTWHPIFYRFSPLPGNPGNILRFKSIGHHTTGFKSMEEAVSDVTSDKFKQQLSDAGMPEPLYQINTALLWDGKDTPVDLLILPSSDLN